MWPTSRREWFQVILKYQWIQSAFFRDKGPRESHRSHKKMKQKEKMEKKELLC